MEKLEFSTNINAPKEKVWQTLWDDTTYRKWTEPFAAGSYAVSDWKEGSKVLFLDGSGRGMVSKVAVSKPNEYMSFEHLGEVKDGIEDTTSDAVKAWAGARENYTLKENNGVTTLLIDMDMDEQHKKYFVDTWPKALEQVKVLAEK